MNGHAPALNKHVGRMMCSKCGLLYLRNPRSERAIKAPCPGSA